MDGGRAERPLRRRFVLTKPVPGSRAVLASTSRPTATAAAGKTKAEACVDCHGEDGKGDDEETDITDMSRRPPHRAGLKLYRPRGGVHPIEL